MNHIVSFNSTVAMPRVFSTAVLAAVAWCGTASAQRMTDYVASSLLATNREVVTSVVSRLSRVEADDYTVAVQHNTPTAGERWEKFETEFAITNTDPSAVKSTLASAKYQLDKSTFAIQEFANNVADALRFDYGWTDLTGSKPGNTTGVHPPSPNPVLDSLENARFKSDINLKLVGETYVGVKLVLPFGN